MSAARPTAGFIGLGAMGAPMAANLARAGHPVTVWNRTAARAAGAIAAGATWARSPGELAARADIVITMLPDTPQIAAVLDGDAGVLTGIRPGSVLVVMATVAPADMVALAARLANYGVAVLDAPVSGRDAGARDATLSIMIGGGSPEVEWVRPLLVSMGRQVLHVGPLGAGQLVKACNQVVVAVSIAGVSEALVLAERAGLDPAIVAAALGGGLAGSRVLETKAPMMTSREFPAGGRSDYQHKDLGIALRVAREYGAVLPVAALVDQLFASLVSTGHGGDDHAALIEVLAALSGPVSRPGPGSP